MPYTLSEIAVRSRPFRVIQPTATQPGDLLRLYTPILQTWRNSAAVSVALYAQGADNEDLKEQDNNTSLEVAALLLLLRFRPFFEQVETWHRSKWLASVAHATGVDAKWMTEAPQAGNRLYRRAAISQGGGVVAAANATPAQAIAANISTAIDNAAASAAAFAKSLSDEAQNRINQALLAGKRVGAPAADVARNINAGLAKGRDRAARGADNEVDNAVKAMTDARMAEAGITEAAWRHYTPKERARPHHLARDGNRYATDDPIWRETYEPFCRCQKRPVLTIKS